MPVTSKKRVQLTMEGGVGFKKEGKSTEANTAKNGELGELSFGVK